MTPNESSKWPFDFGVKAQGHNAVITENIFGALFTFAQFMTCGFPCAFLTSFYCDITIAQL